MSSICLHHWTVTSECPMCLRAEIERLLGICAAAYQLAGMVGAPERFLDALSRADDPAYSIEGLLPILPSEVAAIRWIPVSEELPDADTTVLIALGSGDVWAGYVDDAGVWLYMDSMLVEYRTVTHWTEMPAHPDDGRVATEE